MIGVMVGAKQIGNRRVLAPPTRLDVDARDGRISLRTLITSVVIDEVDGYESRRDNRALLRVLTEDEVRDGLDRGTVDLGGRELPSAPTAPVAIERALEAFGDGLYFVFVDDTQIESLDAEIVVREGSHVLFIRLVALAGG
jgi:hypothetical protein